MIIYTMWQKIMENRFFRFYIYIYIDWQKDMANRFEKIIYTMWQNHQENRLKSIHTIIDNYRCR